MLKSRRREVYHGCVAVHLGRWQDVCLRRRDKHQRVSTQGPAVHDVGQTEPTSQCRITEIAIMEQWYTMYILLCSYYEFVI